MSRLFAVRGATTVFEDTRDAIVASTATLLRELLGRNGIASDDIVSIVFTCTDDLHAEFPAAAARTLGLAGVPMLCARELEVRDSPLVLERCVRILMHVYASARPEPVYLEGATSLLERVRHEEARG